MTSRLKELISSSIRPNMMEAIDQEKKIQRSAVRETRRFQKTRVLGIPTNFPALRYRETLNWIPIRPRDFSLTDSRNEFFSILTVSFS